MIELEPHAAGTILPVQAQAGARRNELRGEHDGRLKVSVTQVAEKGKANAAIAGLLCKALRLKHQQLELIAGATTAHKKFLVRDIAIEELARRIKWALGG